MAKSNVGGTRSKLRGVVGDVIYQIAKNPYGDYEQRIISYTAEKLNRNTRWQCLARMQIAMFQRCMSALTPVIKCSYQGMNTGVTSVNYFVSLNMARVQEFCIEHWKDGGGFSFPYKGREWESFGMFMVAAGTYKIPSLYSVQLATRTPNMPIFKFDLSKIGSRLYDIRKALRFSYDDTINILLWSGDEGTQLYGMTLVKVAFNRQFGDYRVITPDNAANVFAFKADSWNFTNTQTKQVRLNAAYDSQTKVLSIQPNIYVQGLYQWIPLNVMMFADIFSHKKGRVWERNNAWILPPRSLVGLDEWGIHPYVAYQSWDVNYSDEEYDEYFG